MKYLCDYCEKFPCTDDEYKMRFRCPMFSPKSNFMTNADRIRSMSDEELTKWLAENCGCDEWCMHSRSGACDSTLVKQFDTSYKEIFRQEAIIRGVACFCVIDKETYSELPCITGCFQKGITWTVYSTNERGAVYNERVFVDEIEAYSDLANRLGFILSKKNSSENHAEVLLKKGYNAKPEEQCCLDVWYDWLKSPVKEN